MVKQLESCQSPWEPAGHLCWFVTLQNMFNPCKPEPLLPENIHRVENRLLQQQAGYRVLGAYGVGAGRSVASVGAANLHVITQHALPAHSYIISSLWHLRRC